MFTEISKGQYFVGGALKEKMNIYHNSIYSYRVLIVTGP